MVSYAYANIVAHMRADFVSALNGRRGGSV
jgi:hypothetical protein